MSETIQLSPLGGVLRSVSLAVLGGMLYLMIFTGRRFSAENPRVFSLRAVMIPFIRNLMGDIREGDLNETFEGPVSRLYEFSPFLGTVLNGTAYLATRAYAARYKLLACVLTGGWVYLVTKNESQAKEL